MSAAPDWFERALLQKPENVVVDVQGCAIHYLRWGEREKPGIVLVHGGAAHAHWWSFIAPLLTPQYHVVALACAGSAPPQTRDADDYLRFVAMRMPVGSESILLRWS